MEKIAIERCSTYDAAIIKPLLSSMLNGISFIPQRNAKVLIKPNLLAARTPEQAVTTHPSVIEAIGQLFIDCSCKVYIGDSPGFGSTERVLKTSGIMDVIRKLGLTISPFSEKITKHIEGISPYRYFLFGEDPEEYDIVINVPKLKTHGMMGLTLGVKNTFGFIHAFEKAKWHFKAGRDRRIFASAIIDIHRIANPALTVLDGIIGMDGDGPSSGRVRGFNIVAASKNAFCLDSYIEKLVRFPGLTPITQVASEHGFISNYELISPSIETINDLILPNSMRTDWSMPDFVRKMFRNILVKKPRVDPSICTSCSTCIQVCPAEALSIDTGTPVFDYVKCIRCYCCQELCPHKAIFVK